MQEFNWNSSRFHEKFRVWRTGTFWSIEQKENKSWGQKQSRSIYGALGCPTAHTIFMTLHLVWNSCLGKINAFPRCEFPCLSYFIFSRCCCCIFIVKNATFQTNRDSMKLPGSKEIWLNAVIIYQDLPHPQPEKYLFCGLGAVIWPYFYPALPPQNDFFSWVF